MQRLASFRKADQISLCSFLQESGWQAPGSACQIFQLPGLFCKLNVRRGVYRLGAQSSDLVESHRPQPVPLGLLHFSGLQELLPGSLAYHVGLSFFWASSSPPDIDGPASAAIWANCWVGRQPLVTFPPLSSYSHPLSSCPPCPGL